MQRNKLINGDDKTLYEHSVIKSGCKVIGQ
jgi:hypothetical protein